MNNYVDQFDCENYENYFYEILSQLEMEICFRSEFFARDLLVKVFKIS